MSRLPKILKYFRLPPTATAADLKQAYLQRAKTIHPDVARSRNEAAAEEFATLQQRFAEATELIAQAENIRRTERPLKSPIGGADESAVPVVGLPQQKVYSLAAATVITATAASCFFGQRRHRSPAAEAHSRSPVANENNTFSSSCSTASSSTGTGQARPAPNSTWLQLQPGPWCVGATKDASLVRNEVWSPSRSHKFLDSDSFYTNRARGHLRAGIGQRRRLGEKQGGQVKGLSYEADHEPIVRNGVQVLPVHVAASDGNVWWLERCGASQTCRAMLDHADTQGNTPLHHCAQAGQRSTCLTLLRLDADASRKNADGLTAAEIATKGGYNDLCNLLRGALNSGNANGCDKDSNLFEVHLHPDGLGSLAPTSDDVTFIGLKEAESLRRSVNMAAGYLISGPLPVSRSLQEASTPERAEHLVNIVRGNIQSTEFMLEEMVDASDPLPAENQHVPNRTGNVLLHRGLLFFEPPCAVSTDSPGHWFAVRRASAPDRIEGSEGVIYWRLDPVRGSYQLSFDELMELTRRYRSWAMIQGPPHLREEREAKLARTKKEALELQEKSTARQVTYDRSGS